MKPNSSQMEYAGDYEEAAETIKAACYEALDEIATDELDDEQLARIDKGSKSH